MNQTEYARKKGIPRHIVKEAAMYLENEYKFEESQMNAAVIRVLNRRINMLRDDIERNMIWMENAGKVIS